MERLGSGGRRTPWWRRGRARANGRNDTYVWEWGSYSLAWSLALVGALFFLNGISVTAISMLVTAHVPSGAIITTVTVLAVGGFVFGTVPGVRMALVRGLATLAAAVSDRPGRRRRRGGSERL